MGTVVTMHVVGDDSSQHGEREAAVDRAFGWFHDVSRHCSRFDPGSEVSRLGRTVGQAVPVSDTVFEALRFAVALAEDTDGAFDPAVGALMESHGFNRNDDTGELVRHKSADGATYRCINIDEEARTVTLTAPVVIDLNAVVKGMAMDLAAKELAPFHDFVIDAGGDVLVSGTNPHNEPWTIGIRHPREQGRVLQAFPAINIAVCTSGDYERPRPGGDGHHLMDPRAGRSATALASATVIAASAIVADALSTAAFVLGPNDGLALLERHGVEGLLVTPSLERFATSGFPRA